MQPRCSMSGEPFDADETARSRPRLQRPSSFELVVIEGPDEGLAAAIGTGSTQRVLVGRAPSCAVRLSDHAAEPQHCVLELVAGGLRLADLSSARTTRVNGVLVAEALLVGGELVRVGHSMLAVHRRARHGSGEHATLSTILDRDLRFNDARNEVLAEFERRYVERALERAGGNVFRAAESSGVARRYFHALKTRSAR
jgi:hypothetical protein